MRLIYDRGTLLLLEIPPRFACDELPGLRFDARIGAWRAPAYLYASLHASLRAHREITLLDEVPSSWPRPRAFPVPDLRGYQAEALEAWQRAGRRGVISLPTGSGKTRIAIAALARARLRALVLVPTRALVEQWRRALATAGAGPPGCFGDGRREERPITVATFASAERHFERLGGRFDLLLLDEAHHLGGLARLELCEMSVARARLGLSATPPREPRARAELERLIGPVVFERGLATLPSEATASLEHVVVALDLDPEERRVYQQLRQQFAPVFQRLRRELPGRPWSDLVREAARFAEGRQALACWRQARRTIALGSAKTRALAELLARHREQRVLIFTADNTSACAIARRHLLMPITCDVGRRERESALARFRRGELRALVSTRALNEGVDVPDADVAILIGGDGGERAYTQRLGRVLRPGPDKTAIVYELVSRGTPEMAQLKLRREGFAARALARG